MRILRERYFYILPRESIGLLNGNGWRCLLFHPQKHSCRFAFCSIIFGPTSEIGNSRWGTNRTKPEAKLTVIAKSVDLARKITRFCLAVFLWSHTLFLLNVQSRILEYLKHRIHVTSAEAIVFVLLLTFTFVAGAGFGETLVNVVYIYFFPVVLLFYAFYWPIRALRFGFRKVSATRTADIPAGTLLVQATPTPIVLTAPISERKSGAKENVEASVEFLTRPLRKFTFLWCVLVLLASDKPIVWIALTVLLLQLVVKIWRVTRLFWSSKPFLAQAANWISKVLNDTTSKLTSLNFEVASLTDLKNLLNQIKGFKLVLGFLTKSTWFSRLTFGIGLVLLVCAHLYFALIFSCVYVGTAKVAGLKLAWSNSIVISVFILAYVTELPNTFMLRLLGGIHFTLFLALGAGTVVSYFRRQLEPLRSALVSVNMRLSEEDMQQRLNVLEIKVEAAETASKKAAETATKEVKAEVKA